MNQFVLQFRTMKQLLSGPHSEQAFFFFAMTLQLRTAMLKVLFTTGLKLWCTFQDMTQLCTVEMQEAPIISY
jgi:hypothetical protein